jgi:hypothetical protein
MKWRAEQGYFPLIPAHSISLDGGSQAINTTDTAIVNAFFRYPAYHSNADRPEFVQYERMARVVSGLHAVIGDMADIPK